MLLHDYAEEYLLRVDASANYSNQIRLCVRYYDEWAGQPQDLHDLTERRLTEWLATMRDELSNVTRRNRRNMILRIWRAAARDTLLNGDRPRYPATEAVAKIRCQQTIPQAWTVDQVRQLLATVEKLRGRYVRKYPKRLYWKSFLLAGWDTGLRASDLRTFPCAAVAPTFTLIQRKTGKTITGRFRDRTLKSIAELMANSPSREMVWPQWNNLSNWRTCIRRLIIRAGLPGSIGWLRRSAGTACEMAHPLRGHEFLGNTRQVFDKHYLDRRQSQIVQPEEL